MKDNLFARLLKKLGLIKTCICDDDYITFLEKRVIELDRQVEHLKIKNFD